MVPGSCQTAQGPAEPSRGLTRAGREGLIRVFVAGYRMDQVREGPRGSAAGAEPDLVQPTFASAYHQYPPATGAGVAGSKQHMDHVLTRKEEPLWFPDSFR